MVKEIELKLSREQAEALGALQEEVQRHGGEIAVSPVPDGKARSADVAYLEVPGHIIDVVIKGIPEAAICGVLVGAANLIKALAALNVARRVKVDVPKLGRFEGSAKDVQALIATAKDFCKSKPKSKDD